jgi:chemotaxis regulatin CheY-phosphate phosphatase CheZ
LGLEGGESVDIEEIRALREEIDEKEGELEAEWDDLTQREIEEREDEIDELAEELADKIQDAAEELRELAIS